MSTQKAATRIGWLGYGKMGEPMADRIAAAGHAVTVFDVVPERRRFAASKGLTVTDNPEVALKDCSIIVTSLPNDEIAVAALAGEAGLLSAETRGKTLIETSTISVTASKQIAAAADRYGVAYLRAPLSGTTIQAEAGTLTALVSGPAKAFEETRELMALYASTQWYVGPTEEARVLKLALNLILASAIASLAEAFALIRKADIEPKVALDVILTSVVASPLLKFKAPSLIARDFDKPTFTVTQMRKDLGLVIKEARELAVPLLFGAMVEQVMAAAQSAGKGDEDFLVCAEVFERLAGLPPIFPSDC